MPDNAILIKAVTSGDTETVKCLLEEHKAEANATSDYNDQTALMTAALFGYNDIIILLLKHGAKIDTVNYNGYTALMVAITYGHADTIILLLTYGAKINITAKDGQTVLMIAALFEHDKIITLLLENGADVFATDNHKKTVLMLAAQYGYTKIIEVILKFIQKYLSAPIKTSNNIVNLLFSAQIGQHKQSCILFKNTALVNARDINGDTALMIASCNGYADIVEIFLTTTMYKIGINATNNAGDTALIMAARNGNIKIVNLLLYYKADITIANKNGDTALTIAQHKRYSKIVDALTNINTQQTTDDLPYQRLLQRFLRNFP